MAKGTRRESRITGGDISTVVEQPVTRLGYAVFAHGGERLSASFLEISIDAEVVDRVWPADLQSIAAITKYLAEHNSYLCHASFARSAIRTPFLVDTLAGDLYKVEE